NNVKDTTDRDEVAAYLKKVLAKKAFDKSGLIYGMGHAVYSISDPRAIILKNFVQKLSAEKNHMDDFNLFSMVETLAPEVISKERTIYKGVSANVDFYSGYVYNLLGIPQELYTPIFAVGRIVGWSAHRLEELINVNKIIRPSYMSINTSGEYFPLSERK
ncbi:MAG: citrate/2-methylcitrate synthase, partial [Clostridia bacterium]